LAPWAFFFGSLTAKTGSFWVRFWGLLTSNPFLCNKSLGSFPLNQYSSLLPRLALPDSATPNPRCARGIFCAARPVSEPLFPRRPLHPLDHQNRLPQSLAIVKPEMRAPGAGQEGFAAQGWENDLRKGRSVGRLASRAYVLAQFLHYSGGGLPSLAC